MGFLVYVDKALVPTLKFPLQGNDIAYVSAATSGMPTLDVRPLLTNEAI
jgi:hypothetical protein